MVKDHVLVLRFLHRGNGQTRFNVLDEQFRCNSHTLMALAIQNGAYNCIKALVEYGANCNEKDAQDYTYIHHAAVSGHVNIFLYFLSKQVSIHSKTSKGKTAFELAKDHGHVHLINYLRDKIEASNVLQHG